MDPLLSNISTSDSNATVDAFSTNSSPELSTPPIAPQPAVSSSLTSLQIISILIFITVSLISLSAYILVLPVLFAYFKEFKSNFYYLLISLSLVDMLFLTMILSYIVPCIILQRNILQSSPIPGILFGHCFYANTTHLAYIGIVRLIAVSAPTASNVSVEKRLNNKYLVIGVTIVIWCLSPLANTISTVLRGCGLYFNPALVTFTLKCDKSHPSTFDDQIASGILVVSWLLPCTVAAGHLFTWVVLYAKRAGQVTEIVVQKRKRERKLMVQFTLISSVCLLYDASYWFVPKVFANQPQGFVLILVFGLISVSINPFLYLVYNKTMKIKASVLAKRVFKRSNTVQPNPKAVVAVDHH